jgi:hypothetical protein
MVHPPIALERLRYRPETGQVIYYGRQRGRNGEAEVSPARIFPALHFLAALCSHVPDSGQQLIRKCTKLTRWSAPAAPDHLPSSA